MGNFLKHAIDNNKVRSIEDIQSEKGEFEYIEIMESYTSYNNYLIGDLVLVQKYKYKNGKSGYYHIFLIVDFHLNNNNIIYYGMILSSKIEKVSYKSNKLIHKNGENNLRKDSIIKTDVIYKIFTQNILLKIGNIDKTNVEIYKNCLINNI